MVRSARKLSAKSMRHAPLSAPSVGDASVSSAKCFGWKTSTTARGTLEISITPGAGGGMRVGCGWDAVWTRFERSLDAELSGLRGRMRIGVWDRPILAHACEERRVVRAVRPQRKQRQQRRAHVVRHRAG